MTSAPSTLINLQARLVHNLGTVNLGIVGDDAHVQTGGYHIGARSLRNHGMGGDYSLQFHRDYAATHDYACAIDIGGSAAKLQILGNRLVHALKNHDSRVYGRVRGTNAPFDGWSIDRRLDDENPMSTSDDNVQSSDDRGHIHIEIYRTLVLDKKTIDGLYDVLAGVPLRKPSPKPAPKPTTSAGHKIYTVRSGDNLTSIAAANKVRGGWKTIQKLNNLRNPNEISVGQKLKIS